MESVGIFADFQYDAFQWCTENGIKIYCLPAKPRSKLFEIEVNDNNRITRSGKKYQKREVDFKIWELYCHYYLKSVE